MPSGPGVDADGLEAQWVAATIMEFTPGLTQVRDGRDCPAKQDRPYCPIVDCSPGRSVGVVWGLPRRRPASASQVSSKAPPTAAAERAHGGLLFWSFGGTNFLGGWLAVALVIVLHPYVGVALSMKSGGAPSPVPSAPAGPLPTSSATSTDMSPTRKKLDGFESRRSAVRTASIAGPVAVPA
ncbi:hypothetical protein THAOC_17328, partial [Thalassiosira oceanica]